ncbi:MAG TPA: hypothetical protein VGW31_14805, partial [Hanamia sp.]|nr:hypothetical protein [Hanamia sp.]
QPLHFSLKNIFQRLATFNLQTNLPSLRGAVLTLNYYSLFAPKQSHTMLILFTGLDAAVF